MGCLGLEKDLPGLVKFEERLEGGKKVSLQKSTGRMNEMEGIGSTKQ